MANFRIKKFQIGLKTPTIFTTPQDLFYLTGHFLIDGGFLFISNKEVVLFGGHLEHTPGLKSESLSNIGKFIGRAKTVEVDKHISMAQMQLLKKFLPSVKIKLVDSPMVQRRLLKDAKELEAMSAAYQITVQVFKQVKQALREKKFTERQLAQFIRLAGLQLGADDISFPTIVAAGPNAAVPHHVPTDRPLKVGETIVLDFGFKVNGYCSDFTRTVFLKHTPSKLAEIYLAVETAYQLSLAKVISMIEAREVDLAARNYLDEVGYGKYFIHSLGHGTGIDVHEGPHLHPNSKELLQNNMVFSIEPGVYIPKLGGVRIEDLVLLKDNKANYFARASTKLEDMIIN